MPKGESIRSSSKEMSVVMPLPKSSLSKWEMQQKFVPIYTFSVIWL